MKGTDPSLAILTALACMLLLSPLAFGAIPQLSKQLSSYPNASWALGVVVPEGSGLDGGGGVRWGSVANVTALVTLPNITLPDRVVYTVLSVMTSDRAVMQVAVGVFPNRSTWLAYSWLIPDMDAVPLTYQWLLNGSAPSMEEDARVSMSIFRDSGLWNVRVTDIGTGSTVSRPFPPGIAPMPKAGDQEVLALESYSRASATFRDMGNLTLQALLVDGRKVTGGFYTYGEWDPRHSPAFVVGSSGTAPPSFISLQQPSAGSFVWGFSELWRGNAVDYGGTVVATMLVAVLVAAASLVAVAVMTSRKTPR